jgi:hypothetical protein
MPFAAKSAVVCSVRASASRLVMRLSVTIAAAARQAALAARLEVMARAPVQFSAARFRLR